MHRVHYSEYIIINILIDIFISTMNKKKRKNFLFPRAHYYYRVKRIPVRQKIHSVIIAFLVT